LGPAATPEGVVALVDVKMPAAKPSEVAASNSDLDLRPIAQDRKAGLGENLDRRDGLEAPVVDGSLV